MKRLVVAMLSGALMVAMTSGIALAKQDPDKTDCKMGGWKDLATAEGTAFKNQGECVSYVAKGGTPIPDACTELNKPKYDGTYASYGPVTLAFAGGEWLQWAASRQNVDEADWPAHTVTLGGTPYPAYVIFTGADGLVVFLLPELRPSSGTASVEWATNDGDPALWSVTCFG